MDSVTSPRVENGSFFSVNSSSRLRLSDEVDGSKAGKKKSGLANLVNSVLGSPRRINISSPANPVHVTHVGFDNETGTYTVRHLEFVSLALAHRHIGSSTGVATYTTAEWYL